VRSTCVQLALILLFAGVGCGPETDSPDGVDHAGLSTSFGEVVVTYSQVAADHIDDEDAEEETADSPFAISARFVRGADEDRQAVRSLFGEGLPELVAPGDGCSPVESSDARQVLALAGSLELLDAGDVVVRLDGDEARVPDWSFPSVYGVVSGVLYGSDESLPLPFRPEHEYRVSGSGSSQIGSFDVSLVAPDEITGLSVAGAEVGVEAVRIEAGSPVEIRWEPGAEVADVLVELSWIHFGTEQSVLCRSRDDGDADLPASVASRLADPGVTDARLTVYRIVRSTFAADGLDEAEARFVVSVSVPL